MSERQVQRLVLIFAGIGLVGLAAILSIGVYRSNIAPPGRIVAETTAGEITLRGHVLPIGGLKEKTLAAKQAGIKKVVFPQRNEKDMVDIPEDAKEGLEFAFVDHVDDVFGLALKPKG